MSASIIPQLVRKDFLIMRKMIGVFCLVSLASVGVLSLLYGHIPNWVLVNIASVLLLGPAATCGIVLLMRTNVFEKEKSTQSFIMSLPRYRERIHAGETADQPPRIWCNLARDYGRGILLFRWSRPVPLRGCSIYHNGITGRLCGLHRHPQRESSIPIVGHYDSLNSVFPDGHIRLSVGDCFPRSHRRLRVWPGRGLEFNSNRHCDGTNSNGSGDACGNILYSNQKTGFHLIWRFRCIQNASEEPMAKYVLVVSQLFTKFPNLMFDSI